MASDSGSYTPETLARRAKLAEALMGPIKNPIYSPWQGLAEVGQGAIGGYMLNKAERQEREGQSAQTAALAKLLNGDAPPTAPTAAPMSAPAGGAPDDFAQRIAGIESGGKYDALGPETKGDRAYGKYQVMGANVPSWTKAHLGQEMTPEQFLANPQAQDAVFKGQFGQYANKYGPEGAARAWFAGEGGMNNPNARDALGTSVADYAKKFNGANPVAAALNQPTQVAQAQQPAQPSMPTQGVTDNRAKIAAMLNDANPYVRKMGAQLAQGIVTKQLEGEKPTDEMREYQLDSQQRKAAGQPPQSFFDFKSGLKKAGAQNTVINNTVNPILKGVGDRFNESMESARGAIPQIQGIHEARKALDQGAITGTGADPKLFAAKVGSLFGLSDDKASNTEVLRSSIGSQVLAKAKTLGANPSNTDRDYIEKVVGGKIELEEKTIRRLLDMQEKWARDAIKRANSEGSQVLQAQPDELKTIAPLLSVQEPSSYEEFLKANPIAAQTVPPPGGGSDGWKDLGGGVRIRERK